MGVGGVVGELDGSNLSLSKNEYEYDKNKHTHAISALMSQVFSLFKLW